MPIITKPSSIPLATLLAGIALAGCQDSGPAIAPVSGTVTHHGKAVPNLTINFIPNNGRPSWGMTDSSGYYWLHWDEDHDGAEVGTHQVSVAFVPGSQGAESGRTKTPPATPAEQTAISSKYGIEKSPLILEVKPGSQTIDLKLD
ncbi:hypothetical protein SAMN05444166_0990 [Singulisphaera sp. GP187]|uniref:hypothetical protein n=1 Tax=Singulisphaera sp. GP187 TaxID=1882752 RepID=UPI0009265264|nr:hypothetical protein [Singulisphaera sp. GP187]SIN80756.1 hypothetical protein SAMN05444166_0990 [Singulisphaera sp. GP187]